MGLCGSCWKDVHFLAGDVCTSCGVPVPTASETTERLTCEQCHRLPPPWDEGRAAVSYDGVGRQVVMAFKHADRLDMAMPLARWMTGAGSKMLDGDKLLVPIPMHRSKLLRRRYNQAAVLAHQISKRSGLSWCPDLLLRTRSTPELKGKTKEEREKIQSGSMRVNHRHMNLLENREIILIDDVMTTGATLSAATQTLRHVVTKKIGVLTLARVARN